MNALYPAPSREYATDGFGYTVRARPSASTSETRARNSLAWGPRDKNRSTICDSDHSTVSCAGHRAGIAQRTAARTIHLDGNDMSNPSSSTLRLEAHRCVHLSWERA